MSLEYAKRMKDEDQFYVDNTNEKTGPVARWRSNDRIPFEDMLSHFVTLGYIDDQTFYNSNVTRENETSILLDEYRKSYTGPSREERVEARAAHGAGVELVNVITGKRWRT